MAIIWIDYYGKYVDAWDMMHLTPSEIRYVLAVDEPHYPVPALR